MFIPFLIGQAFYGVIQSHPPIMSIPSFDWAGSARREGGPTSGVAGKVCVGIGRAEGPVAGEGRSRSGVFASEGRSDCSRATGGGCVERVEGMLLDGVLGATGELEIDALRLEQKCLWYD